MNRRSFLLALAAGPMGDPAYDPELYECSDCFEKFRAEHPPLWVVAHADTRSGRFSHIKLRRAQERIVRG